VPSTHPLIHARIPFVLFNLSRIDELNDWRERGWRLRASLARLLHLKLVEFIRLYGVVDLRGQLGVVLIRE